MQVLYLKQSPVQAHFLDDRRSQTRKRQRKAPAPLPPAKRGRRGRASFPPALAVSRPAQPTEPGAGCTPARGRSDPRTARHSTAQRSAARRSAALGDLQQKPSRVKPPLPPSRLLGAEAAAHTNRPARAEPGCCSGNPASSSDQKLRGDAGTDYTGLLPYPSISITNEH